MTPLSLAIWWLDDGSIIGNGRKGVLCTDGFDEESVHVLARYLEKVWGVYAHVRLLVVSEIVAKINITDCGFQPRN